jgi:glycosyltransferase involved in cell wall biosynthesis
MNVLHVVTALEGGGAERFVALLLPELAKQDARCSVMTIAPSTIPATLHAAGVDVIEIRRRGRFDAAFLARMISAMRASRPDVVHTHMHHGTYWGRLAAMAAGVPAIVRTEHHPCAPQAPIPGTALANRILNSATAAIVTFSAGQAQYLARVEGLPSEKVFVIPNGIRHTEPPLYDDVAAARARLRIPANRFAVFVLGNLRHPKNQALAIEAVASLDLPHRRRLQLYLVGDGCDRGALAALAQARGVDDSVTFLGYRNDVPAILPAADLLLMPSLSEGMPLALLEAMSAGVPALSTPWNGANDLLEEGRLGVVTADFSPSTLAFELRRIIDDPAPARAAAQRAQVVARRDYAIDAAARLHRALYDRIVPRAVAAA